MPSNFVRGKTPLSENQVRDIFVDLLYLFKRDNILGIVGDIINFETQLLNEISRAQIAEFELRQRIILLESSNTNNISSIQKILNWIYNLTGLNL